MSFYQYNDCGDKVPENVVSKKDINSAKENYTRLRFKNQHRGRGVEIGPKSKYQVYDFATQSYILSPIPILQIAIQSTDGHFYTCSNCQSLLRPGPHPYLKHPNLGKICPDCTPVCLTHNTFLGLDRSGQFQCICCVPLILKYPSCLCPYS